MKMCTSIYCIQVEVLFNQLVFLSGLFLHILNVLSLVLKSSKIFLVCHVVLVVNTKKYLILNLIKLNAWIFSSKKPYLNL